MKRLLTYLCGLLLPVAAYGQAAVQRTAATTNVVAAVTNLTALVDYQAGNTGLVYFGTQAYSLNGLMDASMFPTLSNIVYLDGDQNFKKTLVSSYILDDLFARVDAEQARISLDAVCRSGDTMGGSLYVTGLTNEALSASKFVLSAADKALVSSAYGEADFTSQTHLITNYWPSFYVTNLTVYGTAAFNELDVDVLSVTNIAGTALSMTNGVVELGTNTRVNSPLIISNTTPSSTHISSTNLGLSIYGGTTPKLELHHSAEVLVGNARGDYAVDLQWGRSSATYVASGVNSFVAGTNNIASAPGAIAVGYINSNAGDYTFLAGNQNSASSAADYSVGIGYQNALTGIRTVGIGTVNTVSGSDAMALGRYSTASAAYTLASGYYSQADLRGQFSRASGQLSAVGDSQMSVLTASRTFTVDGASGSGITNDWGALYLAGNTVNRITLASTNTTWMFNILVTAKGTGASSGLSGGYKAEGVIERVVNATAIVGSVVVTTFGEDDTDWDFRVTADDSYETLLLEFYPDDDTARVVATVTLSQISGE